MTSSCDRVSTTTEPGEQTLGENLDRINFDKEVRTRSVNSIREVKVIGWAVNPATPEETTLLSLLHAWDIKMPWHATVFKSGPEIWGIDVITEDRAHFLRQIIMSVWTREVSGTKHFRGNKGSILLCEGA